MGAIKKLISLIKSKRASLLLCTLALTIGTLTIYSPALRGGFVWDDDTHISENATLRTLEGLREIWFKPGATCQYYPLTFTGFWIGYQLWGLDTLGFHLLTLLFHCTVAILLWQVLTRLRVPGAFLAGALFALHPVNVMSVAWMTELKNTLSGSLAVGSCWAYLRFAGVGVYENKAMASRWWFYLLALALFQLGMLAKTAISFLPLTLLLIIWWQQKSLSKRNLLPLLPMWGIALGMGILTIYIERHSGGASGADFKLHPLERVLVSGRSFWFYLGKLVFPHPLIFFYQRWEVNPGVWWQFLYPVATAGFLLGTWLARGRLGKGLWVALAHFYISTSLLTLFVVLYMTRYSFVTDHWQYFGSMSITPLFAAGITHLLQHYRPVIRFGLPIVLLVLLATLSWRQSKVYRDEETLYTEVINRNPTCWLAYNNLGVSLLNKGQIGLATEAFNHSLNEKPDYVEALYNLGDAFRQQGRIVEAVNQYKAALKTDPTCFVAHNNLGVVSLQNSQIDEAIAHFEAALKTKPDYAETHNNLGNALVYKGEINSAIFQYQLALELNPNYAEAHNNLATILSQRGRVKDSLAHFDAALRIKPDYSEAHYGMAIALSQNGNIQRAISEYEKTLSLWPDHPNAPLNLAWIFATSLDPSFRNGSMAVELATKVDKLRRHRDPVALGTLAAAYAESGQFPEALEAAGEALNLATAGGNADLAATLRNHLALYQKDKPIR